MIRGRSFGHPQTQSCTISSGWARLKTPAALGQSSQSMWKRGHRKTALALSRPRESPRNSELHISLYYGLQILLYIQLGEGERSV